MPGDLPVLVARTGKVGVLLVSEPLSSESKSVKNRWNLEKELSLHILNDDWARGVVVQDNIPLVPLAIGDLVAVTDKVHSTMWHRGQITNRTNRVDGSFRFEVLLLDWGISYGDVKPKKVVPLPKSFLKKPFYARQAVLAEIEPISPVVDYSSSNLELKAAVIADYDESAQLFIVNTLKTSSEFRMTVLGLGVENHLHIQLYFKRTNDTSYCCLNDELCSMGYAQRCSCKATQPYCFKEEFWENLPLLPMQVTLEENINIWAVGFSDYVKTYENIKSSKGSQNSSTSNSIAEAESPLSVVKTNVTPPRMPKLAFSSPKSEGFTTPSSDCSANQSLPPALPPAGRGRNMALMKKYLEAQNTKMNGIDSSRTRSALSEASAQINLPKFQPYPPGLSPASAITSPSRSSEFSSPGSRYSSASETINGISKLDDLTPSFGRGALRNLPSSNMGNTEPKIGMKPNFNHPGLDSYLYNNDHNSISAGDQLKNSALDCCPAGMLLPSCKPKERNDYQTLAEADWKKTGARPRMTTSLNTDTVPPLAIKQISSAYVNGKINVTEEPRKQMEKVSPSSRLKNLMKGVTPDALKGFPVTTSNVTRETFRTTTQASSLPPPLRRTASPEDEDAESASVKPLKVQPIPPKTDYPSLLRSASTEDEQFKKCVEEPLRNEFNKKSVIPDLRATTPAIEEESVPAVVSRRINNLKLSAALDRIQNIKTQKLNDRLADTAPAAESTFTGRPDEHEQDMEELMKLVSVNLKPTDEVVQQKEPFGAHQMLKYSRRLEMIEEGRVLVHSSTVGLNHSPTTNLAETSFETIIHENLDSQFKIVKPKVIQAHIWEPIMTGLDVAYVAGSQQGKTLGYLVPILNNLLDKNSYFDAPRGCSPLVFVICPTWDKAEVVHQYCTRLMRKVQDFRSTVLADTNPRNIKSSMTQLVNGVTLLATTAPALAKLLEEAKDMINFDRCFHLVYEEADILISEHADAMQRLYMYYQQSVERTKTENIFVPRQVVACSQHWTKGMEMLTKKGMKTPSIFIGTCMEAAIYGRMKLDVHRGASQEMDAELIKIVDRKRFTPTVIFCRSAEEVEKVDGLLLKIGVRPLVAHNQSIVSGLDDISYRWKNSGSGSAILICTDDVMQRLDIRTAQTLIHYSMPKQSKYEFNFRLSFALDKFLPDSADAERPESHLLITREFKHSLLTIVKFMKRLEIPVSDQLNTEAILSFCGKESRKKTYPLCDKLKSFGSCKALKTCSQRHVVREELDQPQLPKNGVVRIRITAVRDATRYYARILKYWDETKKLVDLSGTCFEINEKMTKHCKANAKSVYGKHVKKGDLYAQGFKDGNFQRVRVDEISNRDHQENPLEVDITYIDQGTFDVAYVKDLFELPEDLKTQPPEAVEIILAGVRPLDQNTSWSRYATDFVRGKVLNKVLDGRIVLALSSTLWIQPLHERKQLDGTKTTVVVMDVMKDIIQEQLAEKNENHMKQLHHLCETGGIELPDYSIGLAKKPQEISPVPSHAFLRLNAETKVNVRFVESPYRFYVNIVEFLEMLYSLEDDILKQMSKFKKMAHEDASPGKLCIAEMTTKPGVWYRGYIQKRKPINDNWVYGIFFVDYGDYETVTLENLRKIPNDFVNRLPFQAIACSLRGIKPCINEKGWTEEDRKFFISLTRADGLCHNLHATAMEKKPINCTSALEKKFTADGIASRFFYTVDLANREETEAVNLTSRMLSHNFGVAIENEEDQSRSIEKNDEISRAMNEDKEREDAALRLKQMSVESDLNQFDVSADWLDFVLKCSQPNNPVPSSTDVPQKKDEGLSKGSNKLIEYAMPLKADTSRFPTTKWTQNNQDIVITFSLLNINDYKLDLSENHLAFVTDVNGTRYELRTNLYGTIVPEYSSHALSPYGVKAVLRKQNTGTPQIWTRLVSSPSSQAWLTRDFTNWMNESDEEEEVQEPFVDPKYAFEDEQYSSDSDDSEANCGDEFFMREED